VIIGASRQPRLLLRPDGKRAGAKVNAAAASVIAAGRLYGRTALQALAGKPVKPGA